MTNNIKKIRGFTLIETLVAVLVLMTAIAGPLTIASRGLAATLLAKDQSTAFYLAQDAVEYVRYVRDTNRLKAQAWLLGLNGTTNGFSSADGVSGDCVSSGGTAFCYVDSLQDAITSCNGNCTAPIKYDSSNNFFSYTIGTNSLFTRSVSIQTTGSAEALVKVTVTWSDQGSLVRTVTVNEVLFDWQ